MRTITPGTATETLTTTVGSPVGRLTLEARGDCLVGLHLEEQRHATASPPGSRRDDALLRRHPETARGILRRRAHGLRGAAAARGHRIPATGVGRLCTIPYGGTISYGELARRVGNPKACRAVGLANGRNPVAIIVPCHRVIAADGTLGGYGGGLDRKSVLLDLEAGDRP